ELDTYLDALQNFPDDAEVIEVAKGRAFLIKKDIFRNLMWYSMHDSTRHYPLSIESVKKIKEQNRQGIKPEVLETVEVVSGKEKEAEPDFVDVVGHISLKSLEKNTRRRRDNDRNKRPPQRNPQQKTQSRQNKPNPNNRNNRPPRINEGS
ncbi:MAG: hypothetical protein M3139_19015, partial [Bacteroidota bacterium]|nr:hypothetical protein [Bacteroidota bacterium]